jgi:hypothetical protein
LFGDFPRGSLDTVPLDETLGGGERGVKRSLVVESGTDCPVPPVNRAFLAGEINLSHVGEETAIPADTPKIT